MKTVTQEKGFTLVELAIVMVIIGLLIGGILKGQELIKNATVSATAAQLKAFESAYTTFLDVYGGKPGDLSTARAKIAACTEVNRCTNGDGNGWIWHGNSAITNPGTNDQAATTGELYQALKHMAAADLIGGVKLNAQPGVDALVAAKIGGYLYVGDMVGNASYHRGGGTSFTPSGIYVSQTLHNNANPRSGRVNTPSETARLDRKIDDGVPGTGSMLAFGQEPCVNGRSYRENNSELACAFGYKIR
jgi:prepilin-type N-terminal cleavage/methylation domain-containing protein